ncbi:hypothetical protein BP00DRAFT_86689 [Aspergillus indologenus CBS 114.80]|uniref:Uncharacterized protein n=1 Tax=Aspergillus indologenus CBS 114.80 TaxID=1450541 RepID=A0A2V5IBD5_9EURO|nr:hypothetical protein BP00DRAFT_86689 [Aspergillus indologenus CBS 114.80]
MNHRANVQGNKCANAIEEDVLLMSTQVFAVINRQPSTVNRQPSTVNRPTSISNSAIRGTYKTNYNCTLENLQDHSSH